MGLAVVLFANQSIGQVTVTSSIVTSPPALACTNTFLTVSGTHNYAGYTYVGPTVVVSGSTVTVTLNYTFGLGIAVITPFTQSVDIGMIPAGNYTLNTNGTVNGNLYGTYVSSLAIVACCPAVSSFTSNQPSYCIGDVVNLTNTSTGSTGQQWYNNGLPVSTSMNYSFTATSPTQTVDLVVTDGACSDSINQSITVYNPPVINSLSVTSDTVCVGELLTFSSSSTGAVGASGKIWFKDMATAGFGTNLTTFAAGAGPHDYTFVATNGACADTSVITVEFLAPPEIDSFNFVSTSVCLGDDITGTVYLSSASSADWFVDDVFATNGTTYSTTPAVTGTYDYKMIVSNGVCSDSVQQTVTINAIPTINLGPDTNACAGNVILDAGSGFSYLWSDATTMQTLLVSDAGTYYVDITSPAGCSASDTIVFTSCIGLNENTTNVFKVGPNPTSSKATILLGRVHPTANVKVIGAEGKLYSEEDFNFVESVVLDVNALENGVYFVQVSTENGSETLRLVKE